MTPNDIPNRWYRYPTHIAEKSIDVAKYPHIGDTSGDGMITEREVIISKLNEELVAYKEAMDET